MKRRQFVGSGLALAAAWPLRGFTSVLKGVGDLQARSLTGGEVTVPGSSIEQLAAGLRGEVMLASSPDYDRTRRLWNAAFDKKPAIIARCTGASDVQQAVNFAREHQLLTAVRAGGHSYSGKSSCDGGLMIDLQPMQGVRVDPEKKRAWVEAGSLLGQLDHECAAFSLATTAGTVSHTGAAGLTLGGGLGRLGRRFGLACDNAASFDLVTAEGKFLRANDKENADLYWGLRGGGGNFGVVTSIEYRLHDMDPVILGGTIVWPLAQARDVLRFYRDIAVDAPDVLNLDPALYTGRRDGPMIEIEACWSGDRKQGEAWLRKLRSFGKPAHDGIAPMPYTTLQASGDELLAPGGYYYLKSGMLTELKDDGIDLIVDSFQRMPDWYIVFFDHCGGAYRHTAPTATAFPNRDMLFTLGAHSIWPSKDGIEENTARMRANWRELAPLTKGFYTNYQDADVTMAGYRENYGGNFERLVALKAKYDPANLFRLNANVPPKIA
ncbi:MAG TPA: FAD-binding oxidoreductase [Steroidobacteraceae bacterium]|nr:FAD-binding oxidoreductase [Steroidobacteraceae bacterium]